MAVLLRLLATTSIDQKNRNSVLNVVTTNSLDTTICRHNKGKITTRQGKINKPTMNTNQTGLVSAIASQAPADCQPTVATVNSKTKIQAAEGASRKISFQC